MSSPADIYVAAFLERCEFMRRPGQAILKGPGLLGLRPSSEHPVALLLASDDAAYDMLVALLPKARTGMVNVFAGASRCSECFEGLDGWIPERTTGLIHRDLRAVTPVSLPSELRLRPVRRSGEKPAGGVSLEEAAATAMRADPSTSDVESLCAYLRSLAPGSRLFAAVDREGAVRATSGYDAAGVVARVLFVNTDPAWRGRGIASAMTTTALTRACADGARHACLDATDAGAGIYRRLGFEFVTRTTRYFRAR